MTDCRRCSERDRCLKHGAAYLGLSARTFRRLVKARRVAALDYAYGGRRFAVEDLEACRAAARRPALRALLPEPVKIPMDELVAQARADVERKRRRAG